MKRLLTFIFAGIILAGSYSCKPKKCANFSDAQKNYKNKYDKGGLVKKKGAKPKRNWGN